MKLSWNDQSYLSNVHVINKILKIISIVEQEMYEKHNGSKFKKLHITTTVPSLEIIKQMVHKILSGQCWDKDK